MIKALPNKEKITSLAIVQLKPSGEGDFYRVETAFISRSNAARRKRPLLWEKSETIPVEAGIQPSFAAAPSNKTGEGRPYGTPEQGNGLRKRIAQEMKIRISDSARPTPATG